MADRRGQDLLGGGGGRPQLVAAGVGPRDRPHQPARRRGGSGEPLLERPPAIARHVEDRRRIKLFGQLPVVYVSHF